MKVIGYDPFLTDARAIEMGIEKVDLDTLYSRADFITLHVPKIESTTNMINKDAIAKMKDGVRILNIARGGLVNEADLLYALNSGKVAGAALDVFAVEPATENPLFGHANVICTPHLGASTTEAQDNVALDVANQIADYLMNGAVVNALNMPSISAEDAPKLKPYLKLSEQLGLMIGQMSDSTITSVEIVYCGDVAKLNVEPLTSTIIASILKPTMEDVNMVSAPEIAKSRGMTISKTMRDNADNFKTAIQLRVKTENRETEVTGTIFGDQILRIVSIDNVSIEAAIEPLMLFIRNRDEPGLIGNIGAVLGQSNINIANFTLGRIKNKGEAVALVAIDDPINNDIMKQLQNLKSVEKIKALKF